jgi:Holliday junction DNA helicase RuvA
MYEYIKGTLIEVSTSKVVVEVHGLAYGLWIPCNHFSRLPALGSAMTFYVSLVTREDSQKLYGFLTRNERDLFENLLDVSGIGPKMSLSLIGHMEMRDLQAAIGQGDFRAICKVPGIGKKTAERLIVEMRDKMKKSLDQLPSLQQPGSEENKDLVTDAVSALIHLGYHGSQAQKAVKAALNKADKEPELAQLITSALHCL